MVVDKGMKVSSHAEGCYPRIGFNTPEGLLLMDGLGRQGVESQVIL